jgi:hypothetical protein
MEEKGVKLSDDTHQALVDYVSANPIFKMRNVADVAIKSWLELDNQAKVISIVKFGEVKQA